MEKNKIMMIVIIILLILILGAFAGFAYYFFSKPENKSESNNENISSFVIDELKPDDIDLMQLQNPINTNLAVGDDGKDTHVARIGFTIGVDTTSKKESTKLLETLKAKEVVIRDIALSVIRNITFEEIKEVNTKDLLKNEILLRLQEEFNSNLIVSIYFGEFYYQ